MRFGQEPLSTPLLVEAIETYFVPLCIFNNTKEEAAVLKKYEEPAWNNPVFRFFGADGKELIERKDGVWDVPGLAMRTLEAIHASGQEIPGWLTSLAHELSPRRHESATFAMYCFWEGERRLGALDGVISTEAAWMDGKEVVDVVFEPETLPFSDLLTTAKTVDCLHKVYAHNESQAKAARDAGNEVGPKDEKTHKPAKPSDRKYYLTKTPMRFVPLTPSQATKANSAIGLKQDAVPLLSPGQRALFEQIVAALSADPKALHGLERPDALDGLAAYQKALRVRLD